MIDPQLTLLPQIEANGMMHMAGFFPSVPTQVNFEMAFAPVDGRWRLFALSVSFGQAAPPPRPQPPPAAAPKPATAGLTKPDRPEWSRRLVAAGSRRTASTPTRSKRRHRHMLPASALKSMRVMFATPCYISAVTMNYVASIFSLTLDSAHLGLPCILHLHSESLIPRGRNKIVIKFLSEDFTHLFWINSDIAFSSQSVFRLLLADRDVAAGVYPMKNFKWPAEGLPAGMTQQQFEVAYTEYPFNPIEHGKTKVSQYADSDGFVEVAEAPTGFMVIKRQVFLAMMKHYPELNYVPDGPPNHPQAHLHWRFFDCMVDPDSGRYLSEDLRLLPALARHGRQDLGRSRLQAHASRPAYVQGRSRRKPARAGALVRLHPRMEFGARMERSEMRGDLAARHDPGFRHSAPKTHVNAFKALSRLRRLRM